MEPAGSRPSATDNVSFRIQLREGRALHLDRLPGVMAVLNVTPDSFSDGGRFASAAAAIDEGLRLADLGVDLLDVGGESTRPRGASYGRGAEPVDAAEESLRVLPVIRGIREARPLAPISVDTRRIEVARLALDAGADVVNLVTGLDPSPELLELVRESGASVVLNHCRGTPADTFEVSRFGDVVEDVSSDLLRAHARAAGAGVDAPRIWLDPGLGFGKSHEQSFALLSDLHRILPAGAPLVVGASRKAFLGSLRGRPAPERLPESLGAVAACLPEARHRALLVRVHDADETLRFLSVLARLQRGFPADG